MEKFRKYILVLMACLAVVSAQLLTACDSDDDYDTNQISGGVSLSAAQLQVTRGGYMVFKGSGLNQIETIIFPENVSVTDIEVVDNYTIRCIVPEEAVVGKVQLVYSNGSKTLETAEIAFTEPITITSFSPKEVKPGDELTITGTYLESIELVEFNGTAQLVTSASRTEVKVIVPIWAKTDKFTIGFNATLSDNTASFTGVVSDDDLIVVAPTITEISATTIKSGETLTITGTQLNQIQIVKFNGAANDTIKNADVYKELTSISVTVPAAATDGVVTLISYAGEEYTTAAITIKQPVVSIKEAQTSYGVGEKVVLEGTDLDLIASATFNGETEATAVTLADDGTISLTVTTAAKSGDITLTLNNGNTITVSGFVTTKPEATDFPTSATPLDVLNVTSTLSSRITTIKFGNLEATPTATETGYTVQVPLEAESGKVIGIMDNGEEITLCESFTANAYTFCAIKELLTETVTVGSLMECTVVNQGNLTGVLLDGESTDYIVNGNKVFVAVGVSTGKKKVTFVSGETKVDYTIEVVGQGLVETILWEGALEVKGWKGVAPTPNISLDDIPSGALLRIRISGTPNSDLQVLDQNWGQGKDWEKDVINNNISISKDQLIANGYGDIDVSNWEKVDGLGIMFNADGVIVSYISYVIDYSEPKTLWEGSVDMGSWENSAQLEASLFADMTTNVTYTVTLTNTEADTQLSIKSMSSGWPALSSANIEEWGGVNLGAETSYSFSLNATNLADVQANGMAIGGKLGTIVKVAYK